jgi:hypothetical protein
LLTAVNLLLRPLRDRSANLDLPRSQAATTRKREREAEAEALPALDRALKAIVNLLMIDASEATTSPPLPAVTRKETDVTDDLSHRDAIVIDVTSVTTKTIEGAMMRDATSRRTMTARTRELKPRKRITTRHIRLRTVTSSAMKKETIKKLLTSQRKRSDPEILELIMPGVLSRFAFPFILLESRHAPLLSSSYIM